MHSEYIVTYEIIFKTIINRKGTSTSIKRNIDLNNILSGLQVQRLNYTICYTLTKK